MARKPIRFPTPATAFTRGYRRALAAGVDPLEDLDAINECPHHRLPDYAGTSCDCWKANRPATGAPTETTEAAA